MAGNTNRHLGPHLKNMSRAKHWVFTLNNYTPEEEQAIRALVSTHDKVRYLCFGHEIGASGTPHLQGYLSLQSRLRHAQVRDLLPRAHIEVRRGSHEEARDYCAKDDADGFYEDGEAPSCQGMRTDLESLKNDLQSGKRMKDIADDHFGTFLKYQRGINAYRNIVAIRRNWICSVVVYWGRTGAGKTKAVYENLPDINDLYVHPGGPWFDGYDSHEIVLFDDFSGSCFKISYLLKLLDRYPMQVPVKGGFVSWCPKEIYFTSNLNPDNWYSGAHSEHVAALFRRFTNIVRFE